WLDPVCALLVSGNIFYESARLILRAFRGLLDEADAAHGESILKTLRLAVEQKKISGFHQLRHREANDVIWIEVHMLVPGNMTTANAHLVVTEIENAIQALFPQFTVHVTTHIEPDEHEEHHPDGHPALIDPYADKSA
ncbi:MAG TPA: cation transporter dimerization domain-containing protein, partial [Candidatus Hydrogenedentes bacterium]|nr:cation transporter dimerization domain-containing protein [Candidatus Hydrogenedentota bacterium]